MPAIGTDFLNLLRKDYREYPNFIETGTYKGATILSMERHFSNLYTVEIKEEFYERAKNEYKGNKIQFLLGDSSIILGKLLPTINGKSIIFLDGHWSAGDTGKGSKDCPLYEELQQIILHHEEEAIIVVDDVRLFGKGPSKGNEKCNWEDINIENVINITKKRITEYYFLPSEITKDDRMILDISKK